MAGRGSLSDSFFRDPALFTIYADYKFVVRGLGGTLATIFLPACGYLIELKTALQAELGYDIFASKLLVGAHVIPDWSWELWLGVPLWMLILPEVRDILVSLAHLSVDIAQGRTETVRKQKSLLKAVDRTREQLAQGRRWLEEVILTAVRRPVQVGRALDVLLGLQTLHPGPTRLEMSDIAARELQLVTESEVDLATDGDVRRALVVVMPVWGLVYLNGGQRTSVEAGPLCLEVWPRNCLHLGDLV